MTTRKPARKAAPSDKTKLEETAVAPVTVFPEQEETAVASATASAPKPEEAAAAPVAVASEPKTAVTDSNPPLPPKAPRAAQSKAVVAATDKVWVKVVGSAPAVIAGARLLPGESTQVLYASYQQARSSYGKALAVRYADSGPYSVE